MRTLELKIPPVALTLLTGAAMGFIAAGVPSFAGSLPYSRTIALSLAVAGASVAGLGVLTFRRAHTSVNPLRPGAAASLVTTGVYRFTRNPMYLGLLLGLTAWALFLGNLLAWVPVPLFVLYMNRFQIAPEEKALAALFDAAFTAYMRKVRRWI